MARSGLTKSQVREVRDRLLAEGRYPSVDAVRHALGDSGSKSTIHKHLKDLRDEEPGAAVQRADTEDALRLLVGQLADKLHVQAEERIRALQAAHAQALRDKDGELQALRAKVDALNARLVSLEQREALAAGALHGDVAPDWRAQRQAQTIDGRGFGRFDSALLSSRSGPGSSSPFDMIRTVARS